MSESKKTLSHYEVVSKAGKARAAKLSPERRKEIAGLALVGRHFKHLPRATHGGTLKLGDKQIECGILPDKTRVISCASIRSALGLENPNSKSIQRAKQANLPTFLTSNALTTYFEQVFGASTTLISYISKTGQKTEGMEATCLPKICEIYVSALADGKLTKQQEPTAKTAAIILSALAKVGIIALVDESSGYQEDRARDELQILLKKFISEDLLKWTQKFPHQFFREVYKIYGWKYEEGKCRHPHYLGHFINKYVYDAISPEVRAELQNKNPVIEETGRRIACHHQFLTEKTGQPALDKHLLQMIAILKGSDNREEFNRLFNKVFN